MWAVPAPVFVTSGRGPQLRQGKLVVDIVIVVEGKTELLEVVAALCPPCCFPGLLNGWEKQCDQDGDDGDDHQQLNERENLDDKWIRVNALHSFPKM